MPAKISINIIKYLIFITILSETKPGRLNIIPERFKKTLIFERKAGFMLKLLNQKE